MKKFFTAWEQLSLRIISLFVTAMLVSFSPEYLRDFFGDVRYTGTLRLGILDEEYNWGFRHTLYFLMCVSLFLVQILKIFAWASANDRKFEIKKDEE